MNTKWFIERPINPWNFFFKEEQQRNKNLILYDITYMVNLKSDSEAESRTVVKRSEGVGDGRDTG